MTTIIMVHGVGGTAEAFSRLAPAFRDKGWRVETPTLRPDKRTAENPPADLHQIRLKDYVEDIAALAAKVEAETGVAPVLLGHSMGGLIVQKLAEHGVGRAAVLLTPASPADCRSSSSLAQAFTFANVLFSGKPESKAHKIWKTGFFWGVLNRVPQAKHAGIYAGTVYDSGGVYENLAYPDRDPERTAFIDETKIKAPILVIGGAKDRATPITDIRKVAEKYARIGAEYREYPDNAHWIVDEPGTDQVIADIDDWLTAKGITPAVAGKAAAKPAVKAKAATPAKGAAKPAAPKASAKPVAKAAAAPIKAKPDAPQAARPAAAGKPTAPATKAKPATRAAAPKPAPAKSAPAKTAAPKAKAAPKPSPAAKPAAPKATAKPKAAAKPAAKSTSRPNTSVRKPKSS